MMRVISGGAVSTCPPTKQPTILSPAMIGAAKSMRPAWQKYVTEDPTLRASSAPCLSHCWHRRQPIGEFRVYLLQKSVKLVPFVTGTPSASVMMAAKPVILLKESCRRWSISTSKRSVRVISLFI